MLMTTSYKNHMNSVLFLLILFSIVFFSSRCKAEDNPDKTENTEIDQKISMYFKNDDTDTSNFPIIVSLGDSYSSGEGIEPFYGEEVFSIDNLREKVNNPDWLAHRSQKSWPGLLKLSLEDGTTITTGQYKDKGWYFAASSGATTEHLKKDLVNGTDGKQRKDYYYAINPFKFNQNTSVPVLNLDPEADKRHRYNTLSGHMDLDPQLTVFDTLDPETVDYVTLTLGGNDAGFSSILQDAAIFYNSNKKYSPDLDMFLEKRISDAWDKYDDPDTGIRENLHKAYSAIAKAAGSQAKIIVAGYPPLLDESKSHFPFNTDEAQMINTAVHQFNAEIEALVNYCREQEDLNIYFVSVEDEFKGHEAYAEDEFINGLIWFAQAQDIDAKTVVSSYSFHPNEKGARVYADCVQKKIEALQEKDNIITDQETINKQAGDYETTEYPNELELSLYENVDDAEILNRLHYMEPIIKSYANNYNLAGENGTIDLATTYLDGKYWNLFYVYTIYNMENHERNFTYSMDEVSSISYGMFDDFEGNLPPYPEWGGFTFEDNHITVMPAQPEEQELSYVSHENDGNHGLNVVYRQTWNPYDPEWSESYYILAHMKPNWHTDYQSGYPLYYTVDRIVFTRDSHYLVNMKSAEKPALTEIESTLSKEEQHKLYIHTIQEYDEKMRAGAMEIEYYQDAKEANRSTYYVFADIDNNGVDELILHYDFNSWDTHTTNSSSGYGENTFIYTIIGDAVSLVKNNGTDDGAYAPTFFHNNFIHVYKGSNLINIGFSHFPEDDVFYEYKDGTLSERPSLALVLGGSEGTPWSLNGLSASSEECLQAFNEASNFDTGYEMTRYDPDTFALDKENEFEANVSDQCLLEDFLGDYYRYDLGAESLSPELRNPYIMKIYYDENGRLLRYSGMAYSTTGTTVYYPYTGYEINGNRIVFWYETVIDYYGNSTYNPGSHTFLYNSGSLIEGDYVWNMSGINPDIASQNGTFDEINNVDSTEYIIYDSNNRYLTIEDLKGLDAKKLRIARNEIYARRGRMFTSEDLQEYFSSKSWYKGTIPADAFDESILNDYELKNAYFIKSYEEGLGD